MVVHDGIHPRVCTGWPRTIGQLVAQEWVDRDLDVRHPQVFHSQSVTGGELRASVSGQYFPSVSLHTSPQRKEWGQVGGAG